MKKLLLLLLGSIIYIAAANAQGNNCASASPFCGGTSYPAGVGSGTAQSGPNYGCLLTQPNPAWYFMQMNTSGDVHIDIHPSPARDVDFILYGPFTSATGACTSQLTAANTEDCSYAGGTADEFADITGGIAGEYYLLLITNYSNAATTVTFSTTSSSTGSISCAVLCSITSLTAVPTACVPATNTYSVSGSIVFNTQPSTGTLTVTSSCGGSQVFNAPFTSPISYNITGITSNGAACNVTAVFSATPSCTRTTAYTSPPNCTPCVANASNGGPICSGSSLSLTAGTVSGATSYHWTGPNGFTSSLQNPTITNASTLASGTYTLTVTTSSATCTATTTAVVNATPATPTASNNGPVCSGTTLNLSTPLVTGATYSWTGPGGFTSTAQNPSISPVTTAETGTYSVTVTANGCTSGVGTTSAVINNSPAAPNANINGSTTPAAICEGGTIALTANNIGGATYSWTGPNSYTAGVRNPPALTNATAAMGGTYTLTVTVGGCTSPPATVSITVNAVPVAPTAADTSICNGSSATLTATAPGGTYSWYDAATAGTLLYTGPTFTTPALTSNTTYYVESAAGTCVGPRSAVNVTVTPSFAVTTLPNDSICSGTSATLGLTSPAGGTYTYSWNDPSTTGFSTSSAPTVSPASTTTYTVTVTNSIGCSGTGTMTVYVGTPLSLNASGTNITCAGACNGQGNVGVSGGFTPYRYSWTTGATSSSVGGLCPGTYTVTVTDAIGCTAQDTVQISEPAPLVLTTSSVAAHCNLPDGSTSVTVTGGVPGAGGTYAYLWMPGAQATSTATNLIPGTYTVYVTDSHFCVDSASATVNNLAGVTATISSSTAASCNAVCDGSATVTAASGTPPYTYAWSNSQTTATISSLCAGAYTCTVTDSTGCSTTAVATITQPTAITIAAIPAQTICSGQSATLTASATGGHAGGYNFGWAAPAYNGNPYVVTPATTTTYTVSGTDLSGCPASNSQTVTVTVRPPLTVTASANDSICPGGNAAISAIGGGGDATGYTYSWMPGGMNTSAISVSPSTNTTYTVTLTDGCSTTAATAQTKVIVMPLATVAFSSDKNDGCAPLCVKFLDASTVSSGSITGWHWDFDGVSANQQFPTHCFANGGQYSVTLTDTTNHGCVSSATIANMISVHDMPTAAFTYNPQPASINYPDITFTDESVSATGWLWNFGDSVLNMANNTSLMQNPTHSYSDVGTYCVTLVVSNTPQCTDTIVNCLDITPDYTIYIPNSFTPDGNGLNEEFFAKGENIAQFEMSIYDRWGNLIFHADDINKHWKGTAIGGSGLVEMGVYVYVINIKDRMNAKHQYIGHVTVVR